MSTNMTAPAEAFLQSGLPGAAVVVLAGVVVYLHLQSEKLRVSHQKELRELQDKLDQEHRNRLDDARQNTVTLLEVHDRQNSAIETLDRAIEAVQRPVRR